MADEIKSPDLDALKRALASSALEVHTYALKGTEVVATAVQQMGEMNLRRRGEVRGEHYPRGDISVNVIKTSNQWATELETPFMGAEFGGHITNVRKGPRFKDLLQLGTSAVATKGIKPMWAPWHMDSKEGYIIGAASHELMESGDADEALGDAMLAGIDDSMDKEGVPRG